jgi:hypothetical protein
MEKVSFVCTTYRRFTCVNRIIAQYHAQTYHNKELIIFNTDTEYPLVKGFDEGNIIVINNNTDYETGVDYTNRGQICRDAVTHATGEYFMLADDDDIYLPWHIQQAVDKINEVGTDAWKPEKSFFATRTKLELVKNTLEASVIVKMNRIREIGFRMDKTGVEGLSWYTQLRDEKQLDENYTDYVPSYCFNWGDSPLIAGHKQSGDIDNPDNFHNHKIQSQDYAVEPLSGYWNLEETYAPYYEFIQQKVTEFPETPIQRYFYSTIL